MKAAIGNTMESSRWKGEVGKLSNDKIEKLRQEVNQIKPIMIIAIDGYACTGKSTVADKLAIRMNMLHVNSGMYYRYISNCLLQKGITETNIQDHLDTIYQIVQSIDMNDYEDIPQLKSDDVTRLGSELAKLPEIRKKVSLHLHLLAEGNDVIIDGRDIGSAEFPLAEHKFFFVVDIEERAKRILDEKKIPYSERAIHQCVANLQQRDSKDISRTISPLRKALDAIEIDRTNLSVDETVEKIISLCNLSR